MSRGREEDEQAYRLLYNDATVGIDLEILEGASCRGRQSSANGMLVRLSQRDILATAIVNFQLRLLVNIARKSLVDVVHNSAMNGL